MEDAYNFNLINHKIETFDINIYPCIETIHLYLWADLAEIRELPMNILKNWKYSNTLQKTERVYIDNPMYMTQLVWEQSFTFAFLLDLI